MSLGQWDRIYGLCTEHEPYGDDTTYRIGADRLSQCELVEDWGCGKGWMRRFIDPDRYRGIDGSQSPFADQIVDLAHYTSTVPGVFLRHVLEHDFNWPLILANAIDAATQTLVIVLFTPLMEETGPIAYSDEPAVPDIAFRLEDITGPMVAGGFTVQTSTHETESQYKTETVIVGNR
jgi:hypothetical protein